MSATFTEFRVVTPLFVDGSSQQIASDQFVANMSTLCQVLQYNAFAGSRQSPTSVTILEGLITTSQQLTALGYLNTLNTALGTPVQCTISTVTSEP